MSTQHLQLRENPTWPLPRNSKESWVRSNDVQDLTENSYILNKPFRSTDYMWVHRTSIKSRV